MSYIEYDKIKSRKTYQPKEVTPDKALSKLTKLCSGREKSVKGVKDLLYKWKIEEGEKGAIIDYLIDNKYVDDSRFAMAYVSDKISFSSWGKSKIIMGLREMGISSEIISEAMEQVDDETMREKIEKEIDTKIKNLKYRDDYDLRDKIIRFSLSRGYDIKIVSAHLNNIIKNR